MSEKELISFNLPIEPMDPVLDELTPEEIEEDRLVSEREPVIRTILEPLFPPQSFDVYLQIVARQSNKSVDELTKDDKGYAKRLMQDDKFALNSIIRQIVKYRIKDNDLETYFQLLKEFSGELSGGQPFSYKEIEHLLGFFPDLERGRMFLSFSKKWNREFSKQNENGRVDNKKYVDLKKALINISGHNIYPAPERKNEEMESVFNTVLNAYKCIYRRGDLDHGADFVFTEQAIRSGFVWGAEQILGETELLEAIPNQLTPEMMERMVDVLTAYSRNHKITPDTISGFSKKLFPAIKNNDPETIPLQKASNSWGMHPGDFGIADFVCRSYALEVNPENIRELLMISREVPTTDQSKFERNRLDALSLVSTFGILRDFIHDQRPLVHEAIEQMVRYYENGDADSLEAVLKKTDYLAGDEARSALLDRTRYDKVIYERMPGNQDGPTIKVIEVLRRLEQNTAPHKSAAPKTTDNELNAQLKTLEQKTDLTGLEEALRYTNNKLAEMMKNSEIGMEPSTVIALGWLEQKVFEFLRDMDLEKQVGAPSSTWFREILRFNELTSSPNNYDENEFNAYLEELKNEPEKAYKKIGKRVLDNISALSESFKKKGRKDLGPLWSGNISHELVSLIDPRTASTKIGKRIGEEMRKSISEPGYHPGD